MKIKLTLLAVLLTIVSIAQTGINYKATIKNGNGNILSNEAIDIQFIIYEGAALTNNVYQESHTVITDANGLIMTNIGTGGQQGGVFTDVDWNVADHFLNVQVDTGNGFVDLGTTQFMAVPYAKVAENVSGLEAIDQGNGIGWRLIGRNENNYDPIGFNAIDYSFVDNPTLGLGATGSYSFSLGHNGTASGEHAFTFGNQNYSLNDFAVTIGNNNIVSGLNATAIGAINQVSGDYAFALGLQNEASENYSVALGTSTTASGVYAIAIGQNTTASGLNATAFGRNTEAIGEGAVAMGSISDAIGAFSFAVGEGSQAQGDRSVAMGENAFATGNNALAIGRNTFASGSSSVSIGIDNNASAFNTITLGNNARASSGHAVSIGRDTNASGFNAMAMGNNTTASGSNSFAIGDGAVSQGDSSIAMGTDASTSVFYGVAIGRNTNASSVGSMALGTNTLASGTFSTAIGLDARASDYASVAIGNGVNASGRDALALGINTNASGISATAMGVNTVATGYASTAVGYYNIGGIDALFEVGNGISTNRSNAFTVRRSGNVGIGTNTPQELLHIDGGRLRIGTETIEDTGTNRLSFNADLLPDSDNAFRLGNSTTRWTSVWAADGSINTSDRREKENIVNLTYGLKEIQKLKPVSFSWKKRPEAGIKLGLIAQDLQAIIPEVVMAEEIVYSEDDPSSFEKKPLDRLGVYYSDLIPVLIKAIQEQQEIIASQTNKVEVLEASLSEKEMDIQELYKRIVKIEKSLVSFQ